MKLEVIGWIGAISFSLCAFPQLVKTLKDGHAKSLTWGLLLLWLNGEICMFYYLAASESLKPQLVANYCFNIFQLCVMLKYKVFPRKL